MPDTKDWRRCIFEKKGYVSLYYGDNLITSIYFGKVYRRKEIFKLFEEKIKRSKNPELCFISVVYNLEAVNRGVERLEAVTDTRTKKKLKRIYNRD